jgi:Transposase DDE domain
LFGGHGIIAVMYVVDVPNRNSPPATLLRESYRENGKVKNRTLANLSHWPRHKVEALKAVLKDAEGVLPLSAFENVRSLPHGHVAATLGTLRRLGVESMLGSKRSRPRDLSVAMIVSRVLFPGSKLALVRSLREETASSSLGALLEVGDVDEDELYAAMDWLLMRQQRIETALAERHLAEGTLVLYDVSSTYFEGRRCPLARIGHSRDGRFDRPQIVFGLLTDAQGCPVATEVFAGNTGDPATVLSQVKKLRERFHLQRVVLVGDRGMITSARIEQDLKQAPGLEWITALRGPAIRKLVDTGVLDVSLFDERDLAEVSSPEYPGERLIVCRNPLLAAERSRKREDLLQATERELDKIGAATRRSANPLRGKDHIGLRVGRVLGRFKVGKHFKLTISESSFSYQRNATTIAEEASLDGIYVIRTSVASAALSSQQTVLSYKRLAQVERAFRCIKTVDLRLRPIHHHLADRVRAHVFICMLAYYVEWHMRHSMAPMLFEDDDKQAAARARGSAVAKAQRSATAERKARTKLDAEGQPVHSFRTLLGDLATIVKNLYRANEGSPTEVETITSPTPLQQRALDLLAVRTRL